jgi:hypothetical protein
MHGMALQNARPGLMDRFDEIAILKHGVMPHLMGLQPSLYV